MTDASPATSTDLEYARNRLRSRRRLIAATLAASLVAAYCWVRSRDETDPGPAHDLEQLGASVNTRVAVESRWIHDLVSLERTQVQGDGLRHLSGLARMESLKLRQTGVTDADLIHLAGLTNLQWLRLDGTQVTDVGIQHLSDLTNLRVLSVTNTSVTDTGAVEPGSRLIECNVVVSN